MGLELGRACVDALVDGEDPFPLAPHASFGLADPRQGRDPRVGETHPLRLAQGLAVDTRSDGFLELDDLLHLVQEPGIDPGHLVDLLLRPPEIKRAFHVEDPVRVRC